MRKIINKFAQPHTHFIARVLFVHSNLAHGKIGIAEIDAASINPHKYFIDYIYIQRRTKLNFANLFIFDLDKAIQSRVNLLAGCSWVSGNIFVDKRQRIITVDHHLGNITNPFLASFSRASTCAKLLG